MYYPTHSAFFNNINPNIWAIGHFSLTFRWSCITLPEKLAQEGNMASITKKIKKGRPYYYAVESKRVNGKPRIVWQKYLGTLEAIVNRTEDSKPPKPQHTVI